MNCCWQYQGEPGQGDILPPELLSPRQSLLETIAVLQGRPIWWSRHLTRLSTSAAELGYPETEPDPLHPSFAALWRGERGRLRCLLFAEGGSAWSFERDDLSNNPLEVAVIEVEQPLGGHKQGNRERQEQLLKSAVKLGAQEALLLNSGKLLEGTYSNCLLHDASGWLTPPLDGRILPGIMRDQLIRQLVQSGLQVRQETTDLDQLRDCNQFVLCNSLRGIIPVSTVLLPTGEKITLPRPVGP